MDRLRLGLRLARGDDRLYPAPSPAHDFLVDHRYGPDYMVPMRPVMSVWLYPDLGPDDMTPTVKRMLSELADEDRRLAELNYRSRLGRRVVRVAQAVAAKLGGRPRRGFGEPRRSVHRG